MTKKSRSCFEKNEKTKRASTVLLWKAPHSCFLTFLEKLPFDSYLKSSSEKKVGLTLRTRKKEASVHCSAVLLWEAPHSSLLRFSPTFPWTHPSFTAWSRKSENKSNCVVVTLTIVCLKWEYKKVSHVRCQGYVCSLVCGWSTSAMAVIPQKRCESSWSWCSTEGCGCL